MSICGCVFFPEIFQKPYIYSDISVTSIVMVSMAYNSLCDNSGLHMSMQCLEASNRFAKISYYSSCN